MKGITFSIFVHFPDAKYQWSLVHISRNISHEVRVSDRAEICENFKTLYRAENLEIGQKAHQDFEKKWETSYLKLSKIHLAQYLFN